MSYNPSSFHPSRMHSMNSVGPAGLVQIDSLMNGATRDVINIYQAENIFVFNTPGEYVIRSGPNTGTGHQEGPNRRMGPPPSPRQPPSMSHGLGVGYSTPAPPRTPDRRGPRTNASCQTSPATVTVNDGNGIITPATPPRRTIGQEGPRIPLSCGSSLLASPSSIGSNECPFCASFTISPGGSPSSSSFTSTSVISLEEAPLFNVCPDCVAFSREIHGSPYVLRLL